MTDKVIVYTTCGNNSDADKLARALVEQRLAACVNVVDGARSIYRWNEAVEQASEALLVIKTMAERYGELEAAIRERSTYELPEIVAVPIAQGLADYLEWVRAATAGTKEISG